MKYEKNREKKVFGYRMSEDEQEYVNNVIKKYKRITGKTTTNIILIIRMILNIYQVLHVILNINSILLILSAFIIVILSAISIQLVEEVYQKKIYTIENRYLMQIINIYLIFMMTWIVGKEMSI